MELIRAASTSAFLAGAIALAGVSALHPTLAHGAATGPGGVEAYDCNQIEETARDTFEQMRQAQREEITRPPDDGGAFSTPGKAKNDSCAVVVLGTMENVSLTSGGSGLCGTDDGWGSAVLDAIGDFFGDAAASIVGSIFGGIVGNSNIADCVRKEASRSCEVINQRYGEEMARLRAGVASSFGE